MTLNESGIYIDEAVFFTNENHFHFRKPLEGNESEFSLLILSGVDYQLLSFASTGKYNQINPVTHDFDRFFFIDNKIEDIEKLIRIKGDNSKNLKAMLRDFKTYL